MIGTPHVHHRVADSTNERAKALAAAGAPHGTLVTADEQTAGRGRQGRSWLAEAGAAVLMSVVLRPPPEALPLAAAVAVAEAVPVETAIKWPNDVLVDGRKLAGILVEGRPQEGWVVLGIGLNVSGIPAEVSDIATALGSGGREEVLSALLERLDARLSSPLPEVLDEWRRRDALLGREIRWDGGSGVAAGIDADGSLLVETGEGQVALVAGEVHLSRG
ncbi:MAG: biotin--[acetyl-CoA-carboxylase] ligase [Thermoleophilaceae bacterium]|nr:biotin--[acetyl-CoA-carboxylase] ligase [Thermoleophilaceae bacterium]